jgi:hypothetical protein
MPCECLTLMRHFFTYSNFNCKVKKPDLGKSGFLRIYSFIFISLQHQAHG